MCSMDLLAHGCIFVVLKVCDVFVTRETLSFHRSQTSNRSRNYQTPAYLQTHRFHLECDGHL